MANFTPLRNKENKSVKPLRNTAASIAPVTNKAKVNEKQIATAVKSDATAKTSGGAFGSFIKQ